MFYEDRKTILKAITILQRSVCAYDSYKIKPDCPPPERCDCKYGAKEFKTNVIGHEKSFCPELRCVIKLLENINDKEYHYIMERKNNGRSI